MSPTHPTHGTAARTTSQQPRARTVQPVRARSRLREALHREGAGWAEDRARRVGAIAGSEGMTWAPQGEHPHAPSCARTIATATASTKSTTTGMHDLMRTGGGARPARPPLARTASGRARRARRALLPLSQAEAGHGCPISMTYSRGARATAAPDVAANGSALTSTQYDPRSLRPRKRRGRSAAWP